MLGDVLYNVCQTEYHDVQSVQEQADEIMRNLRAEFVLNGPTDKWEHLRRRHEKFLEMVKEMKIAALRSKSM